MRDPQPVLVLVLGMGIAMMMFAMLVVIGPGVVPSQLNACWVELQKQTKDCSSRTTGGKTYIKDSRCLTPSTGLFMVAEDDSGWYRVGRQPTPAVETDPNE